MPTYSKSITLAMYSFYWGVLTYNITTWSYYK